MYKWERKVYLGIVTGKPVLVYATVRYLLYQLYIAKKQTNKQTKQFDK